MSTTRLNFAFEPELNEFATNMSYVQPQYYDADDIAERDALVNTSVTETMRHRDRGYNIFHPNTPTIHRNDHIQDHEEVSNIIALREASGELTYSTVRGWQLYQQRNPNTRKRVVGKVVSYDPTSWKQMVEFHSNYTEGPADKPRRVAYKVVSTAEMYENWLPGSIYTPESHPVRDYLRKRRRGIPWTPSAW